MFLSPSNSLEPRYCFQSESPNGMCAKLYTVAASNNRVHPTRSLSSPPFTRTMNCSPGSQALWLLELIHQDHSIGITLLLLGHTTYRSVLFFTHIPFVVNRVFSTYAVLLYIVLIICTSSCALLYILYLTKTLQCKASLYNGGQPSSSVCHLIFFHLVFHHIIICIVKQRYINFSVCSLHTCAIKYLIIENYVCYYVYIFTHSSVL